jgi:hypothetical protein
MTMRDIFISVLLGTAAAALLGTFFVVTPYLAGAGIGEAIGCE